MTSIAGFAEMLAEGYAGELPPTAVDYVAAILDSVARLGALIDNVLDLTQSDTGSLLLAEDEVDLAALCAERRPRTREALAGAAGHRARGRDRASGRHRHRRSAPARPGARQSCSRTPSAYTPAGGRVLLRAEGDRDEARIIVSDNGRGIAPADQARVFDRFSRTAEGRTGEEAAIGLGLPLAKQFVEAHGGTIELQSEPGEGTTVTIRLPRTAEQRAECPVAQVADIRA